MRGEAQVSRLDPGRVAAVAAKGAVLGGARVAGATIVDGAGGRPLTRGVIGLSGASSVYDGTEKAPAVTGVFLDGATLTEWADYVLAGEKSAVHAGEYEIRALGVMGYSGYASAVWRIEKAQGSVQAGAASVTLDREHRVASIAVSCVGDGEIYARSSDGDVATVSVTGGAVTVSGVGDGSAVIAIGIGEGADYLGAEIEVPVSVSFVSPVLSENDPATIQRVARAGRGANYWSVGDVTAPIALTAGTVGDVDVTGLTLRAVILGFDHNSALEGTGIHFQLFTDAEGANVALADPFYMKNGSSAAFRMNTSLSSAGGWGGSYMRNTICAQLLDRLPAEWRAVIAPCVKYTDNTGGGRNNAEYVTATEDELFLLSEYEVFGARTKANSAEQEKQAQYAYYAGGAHSPVRCRHDAPQTACHWWLRSPYATTAGIFCRVKADGNADYYAASFSLGFAPAFKVA